MEIFFTGVFEFKNDIYWYLNLLILLYISSLDNFTFYNFLFQNSQQIYIQSNCEELYNSHDYQTSMTLLFNVIH